MQLPKPSPIDVTTSFRTGVRAEDAAAVRDIVSSTGFFHDFEVDVAVELVEQRLARGLASEYYFLFADDPATGRTIGYACFGPIACTQGSFDLYWIAVHQEVQKRGLGGRLLAAAESMMRDRLPGPDGRAIAPARRVYIETSSQPKYKPTQAFYERCGYVEEARLKGYYAAGDDKIVYVKALA
jgi:D-alanine-D-alanine ligase